MKRLSHKEMKDLLASIALLNSGLDLEGLPSRLFGALSNCISSEIIAFDGLGSDYDYQGQLWYNPAESVSQKEREAFEVFVYEHPFFDDVVIQRKPDSYRISDRLSDAQLHKTGLYNEFYRLIGIDHQMLVGLDISPQLLVSCALNRTGNDFSERDMVLLSWLSPHLTAAIRNTQAFERLEHERDSLASIVTKGLAISDAEGKLTFMTDPALRLMNKYFPDFDQNQLPDALHSFAKAQIKDIDTRCQYEPASPYRLNRSNSELVVRLVFDSFTRRVTLFLEEVVSRSIEDFRSLGLTRRESEILYWIGGGKTNFEIATLCGISRRTVQKHVENIFIKLGVETRTGAIMTALEKMKKQGTVKVTSERR